MLRTVEHFPKNVGNLLPGALRSTTRGKIPLCATRSPPVITVAQKASFSNPTRPGMDSFSFLPRWSPIASAFDPGRLLSLGLSPPNNTPKNDLEYSRS